MPAITNPVTNAAPHDTSNSSSPSAALLTETGPLSSWLKAEIGHRYSFLKRRVSVAPAQQQLKSTARWAGPTLDVREIELLIGALPSLRTAMEDQQVGWIAAIIIGGIAGWLAEQFMKTRMGLLMNIVLGMIGAAVASWLFGLLGVSFSGWIGYLIAGFVGAVILIAIGRAFKRTWRLEARRRLDQPPLSGPGGMLV
jgi:uncharacterized membrane protein YeaQ/YmgE (transglycosylase-associated protein family)